MSATTWKECASGEHAEFGRLYRTTFVFHKFAWGLAGNRTISLLPLPGTLLAGGRIRIVRTQSWQPNMLPAEMRSMHRPDDWAVRVTWEKVKDGTPVVVYAAAIMAVIVTATFMWILAAKTTEKEMHQVAEDFRENVDKLKDLAQETIFNPGLIVAALVVAVMVLKRR